MLVTQSKLDGFLRSRRAQFSNATLAEELRCRVSEISRSTFQSREASNFFAVTGHDCGISPFIYFIYITQLVVHDQLARKVRERGDSQPRQEKKRKEYRKREERRIDKNPAMRFYRTTLCDRSAFLKLERHFDVLTSWGSCSQRL